MNTKKMSKAEFISSMREGLDKLENGNYFMIDLPEGYIFGNKNYGEVSVPLVPGVNITISLFTATKEEGADD